MSKNIQLILAALLAIGAFLHHQHREKELLSKQDQLTTLQRNLADHETRSRTTKRNSRQNPSSSTSTRIAHLRKLASDPLDPEIFSELLERKYGDHHDGQAWPELFFALMNRDQAELATLLEELKNADIPNNLLQSLERDISQLHPSQEDFGTQIRDALHGKPSIRNYTQLFTLWLSSEPDIARKWLDQELESRTIIGKGLDSDPVDSMTKLLVSKLFIELSPDALAYYDQLSDIAKLNVRFDIASKLNQAGPEKVKSFFETTSNPKIREQVISTMVRTQAEKDHSRDDIITSSQSLNLSDKEQTALIQSIAQNSNLFKGDSLQTQIDWVQHHSETENLDPFIHGITLSTYREHREELESWTAQQTNPATKDKIYQSLIFMATYQEKNHQRAAHYLAQISDLKTQQKIYRDFSISNIESSKKKFDQQLIDAGVDLETLRQD